MTTIAGVLKGMAAFVALLLAAAFAAVAGFLIMLYFIGIPALIVAAIFGGYALYVSAKAKRHAQEQNGDGTYDNPHRAPWRGLYNRSYTRARNRQENPREGRADPKATTSKKQQRAEANAERFKAKNETPDTQTETSQTAPKHAE